MYLSIERQHGLDRHCAGMKLVLLEHLFYQTFPVFDGIERWFCQKDLVVPGINLHYPSPQEKGWTQQSKRLSMNPTTSALYSTAFAHYVETTDDDTP